MNRRPITVVGIGASAGGIDAFHSFFEHMKADSGMAFVVILHLPADRPSMLRDILSHWTAMRVLDGVDGTQLEPNTVYVPPPHALATLVDGQLKIIPPVSEEQRLSRPIDTFFDSLATSLQAQAIGVVLSGTGSDGALGLKAIKEAGGLTIAQGNAGKTPQYGEMPAGAIATGAVDVVAPIAEIPEHLLRIAAAAAREEPTTPVSSSEAKAQICALLRGQVGHDFSGYRDATFMRRVQRRMQVVNAPTLDAYLNRLQSDHGEGVLLFRDLLIRVTSFFRDATTFSALATLVMPRLFADKKADGSVRVWVPGCATGEEAYSLAILLREFMDGLQAVPKVQIFATDIEESAIETARLGRYPATLLEGLSSERRNRFFRPSQGNFVVSKEIRDLCTFSPHNLVRDPPFSRMNMVSCRNLLIYMDSELQSSVIPAFHYSLVPQGILLLGGAEGISKHVDLFEPLDKTSRIFVRRDGRSPPLEVDTFEPDLCHIPPEPKLPMRHSSDDRRIARPRGHEVDPLIQQLLTMPAHEITADAAARLQQELRGTQEQFHSLVEEHETALEELRSANEELHSVNEEMQSTNEELETSKEELQSVNEELHTVNLRLSEKIDELDSSNSDLRNLFESTQLAMIFLDKHLIIRSFTPAMAALYRLIPSDEGRPLTDMASRLEYSRLPDDVATVLQTLTPVERRISRADRAAHYSVRVLPYRDLDGTVSGVLVTFIDISGVVQAEAALLEADLRKDVFLATLSHELRNPLAPVRTAARLLESPDLTRDQLDRARGIISRQVRHMTSLLDDLLDVSRITRGSFVLKRALTDVKSVIEPAVEAVQGDMEARGHTLRLEIPDNPARMNVDAVRMTQVITNLLTNAAKYTPQGGLITAGAREEAGEVCIFVHDNGIGIAPSMRAEIFNMFTRVSSDERTEGGLGIGLALVKGLVELHGGRIEVRSEGTGQGSEFVVTLPRASASSGVAPTASIETPAAPPSKRILIADDNRDAAEMLGMFLDINGHEVHLAYSGAEAIEVAARVHPDVAILDIGMPSPDGYAVARHFRAEPWGSEMVLIALTGWGQHNDKQRAIGAGFDHHCTKPVDPSDIERFFRRSDAANDSLH